MLLEVDKDRVAKPSTRLEAIVEFTLKWPYAASLLKLQDIAILLNMKLVSANTNQAKAVLTIDWRSFKARFGRCPSRGDYPVPEKMGEFVSAIKVTGSRVVDIR